MIRELGTPCLLCGAARKCRHSEPEAPRQLRETIPDKPDGRERISGGGRYQVGRHAARRGPKP